MDAKELERFGLNGNEAKVYYALLLRGRAPAQELIKSLGVHRNIVYDNLEKLMEKGLVSTLTEGSRRVFVASPPAALIEFLESRRKTMDQEIELARQMLPQVAALLSSQVRRDVSLYRGTMGLKKVLLEIVQAKTSWCIGITNDSVKILGEAYWKNYNLKKKESSTTEYLLLNHDFQNTVIPSNPRSHHRVLPKELDQVTETIMYNGKVAVLVFSAEPIVILMDSVEIFEAFRKHFDFLWNLSVSST